MLSSLGILLPSIRISDPIVISFVPVIIIMSILRIRFSVYTLIIYFSVSGNGFVSKSKVLCLLALKGFPWCVVFFLVDSLR